VKALASLEQAVRAPARRRLSAILTGAAAVAAVTAAISLFRDFVPVLALGVLYLFAILPVAVLWGRAYAIGVSVVSVLALNWFFLPPEHTFTLADEENWYALAVYLATGVVVADLATRARDRARDAEQREREAAFLADLASSLLSGVTVELERERIASGAAGVLGIERARLDLRPVREPPRGESPLLLRTADGRDVGVLYVREGGLPNLAVRRRFLPALAALLAVALDRERLAADALDAAALRRSDAIKTAILQAVSHDLRSPLTAIRIAADALASGTLELAETDRAELVATIQAEVTRLERVVADLLDISRLEAGAVEAQPELWGVEDLVAQAVEALGGSAAERIRLAVEDGTPSVLVDAVQIERVLVNVLENALRLSPPDAPVELRTSTTRRDVILRVVDRGPGLAKEDLERVFEAFERGGGRAGRSGTGLGLAIARGFAEANGARLWAESRPGQGAVFALALPAAESAVALP
jgi:two-component system sensor histidine kinase KdpD